MKKFFIGLLLVAIVGLAVGGGIFLYQQSTQTKPTQSNEQGETPKKKKELTAMSTPKNEADIYDNLHYATNLNHDAVAWLDVPETDINNVVMQGDNNDFYLRRDENKESDIYGCYFADYECALGKREDFLQNTIIYGHGDSTDNPDGKRFAQLFRFEDAEFAKKVPYVYVTTPEGRFTFEIFSVFYTKTDFDYIQVNISDKEKLELAKQAKELSVHPYEVTLTETDKLLTLSTCTVKYDSGVGRFVLMARLCEEED